MYVLNEYMEFGVDTPHIVTYNFKLVFHLLFSTIYSIRICTEPHPCKILAGFSHKPGSILAG